MKAETKRPKGFRRFKNSVAEQNLAEQPRPFRGYSTRTGKSPLDRECVFHYSDTWQLVINTAPTIVTFLMVFLIQAAQNRDTLALQIKVSELILALEGARNELAAVEQVSNSKLEDIADEITDELPRGGSESRGRLRHFARHDKGLD